MLSTMSLGWQQKWRRSERRKVSVRHARVIMHQGGSQMSFFGRVLTAMVTPFDEGTNVDYPQAAALAKRLADSGSDGIVVAGKTRGAPPLTDEKKIPLFWSGEEGVGGPAVVVGRAGTH